MQKGKCSHWMKFSPTGVRDMADKAGVSGQIIGYLYKGQERLMGLAQNEKSLHEGGFSDMVGRDGFEPSTNWLKANCSTG